VARILIVDDEPNITEMIAHVLAPLGREIDTAGDGAAAIDQINTNDYQLIITDVNMPGADGFAVLDAARGCPGTPPDVIIITGFGTVDSAVKAMKAGAADYVAKPLDVAKLSDLVKNVLARRAPKAGTAARARGFDGLIGRSRAMKDLHALIKQVAPTPSTVMISGESGSGKELVARAIHHFSPRNDGPFIAVDCGALTETLLESELFGHVKGAFTGAVDHKTGLFEAAEGGTVFLDEIGEMSPGVQQKLLRSIQERAVRPVGSTRTRPIDVRVISATNRDIARMVATGAFREDLYFRLKVVPVHAPSLAERREDIPMLAKHFAKRFAERMGRSKPPAISDTVMTMLTQSNWPGNVRQLENVIECAVTFTQDDAIRPEHLPPDFIESFAMAADLTAPRPGKSAKAADVTPLGAAIQYLEHQMLSKALDVADGNREKAAGMLGIDRATLYRKLKAHKFPNGK
jgi:DNA-binding NtrC family response regulator